MPNSQDSFEAPIELSNDAGAGKKKRPGGRSRRIGIIAIVMIVVFGLAGVGAWIFLSAPTPTVQPMQKQSKQKPKRAGKNKNAGVDAHAVDATATGGARPQDAKAPRRGKGRDKGKDKDKDAQPAAPGALPPVTEEGAKPHNPLNVESATAMMADTEEMRLKTAYAKELASYNKAQTEAVVAAAALEKAKAEAAGMAVPGADGKPGGGAAVTKADVEKMIAEAKEKEKKERAAKKGAASASGVQLDRSASGKITGVQRSGRGFWASARTLDGEMVRLDVGSKWNGGRVSSITANGVAIKYEDGSVKRHPF